MRWSDSIGGILHNHNQSIFLFSGCWRSVRIAAAQRPPRQRRGTRFELLDGRQRASRRHRRRGKSVKFVKSDGNKNYRGRRDHRKNP
nr:MAG TPA: hypothetical protein [Caudoviricetes sp.]DAU40835.1 MAG TPA: hypothetical protein [Caudoviricetes sp.]